MLLTEKSYSRQKQTLSGIETMPEILTDTGIIVLAGGHSERMGMPKSLLPFSEFETFLDHILGIYSSICCSRAVVVLPRVLKDHLLIHAANNIIATMKITYVVHDDPDADRMESVVRGLENLPEDMFVFLQDVDRPFVDAGILRTLLEHRSGGSYTVPDIDGHGGHPVLLSPLVAADIRIRRQVRTLRDVLHAHPCVRVPIGDAKCNININTPEEYRKYIGMFPSIYDMEVC